MNEVCDKPQTCTSCLRTFYRRSWETAEGFECRNKCCPGCESNNCICDLIEASTGMKIIGPLAVTQTKGEEVHA